MAEAPKPMENKETLSGWQEFAEAMAVFAGDLDIVGHGQEEPVSPFAVPKEYGEYTLTQLPEGMTEEEFKELMAGVDTIVISCMDKRVAYPVWQQSGGPERKVLLLAVGGGVVQNKDRWSAMEKIAQYLSQFKIDRVAATDHDHVCGAVKYFLGKLGLENDSGLPGLLGKKPGEEQEKQYMEKLIRKGAKPWIEAFGEDKVELQLAVVDEEGQTVAMKPIPAKGDSLTVEDLAAKLDKK